MRSSLLIPGPQMPKSPQMELTLNLSRSGPSPQDQTYSIQFDVENFGTSLCPVLIA